ncbi:phage tail domain-containing protein [Weissella viridescens]|uniref:phage tail domain-containing protein n=1 Tax=Weissella viridescens TaxID=1629 RepID=UPI003AF2A87A
MKHFYIKQVGQDEVDMTQRISSLEYLDGAFTPNFINSYQDNAGTDGSQLTSVAFGKGTFVANFYMPAADYQQHQLMRHEFYRQFGQRPLLRVRTSDDPDKCFYGRPVNVPLDSMADGNNDFKIQLTFEVPSGFMYSVHRSDQMSDASFGMNLVGVSPEYVHNENAFKIYNASDIQVDPYYQRHDMKIEMLIDGPITIRNQTNGTQWSYKGKLPGKTKVVLDGLVTYKNGVQDSLNSDFGFIKLEPGENNIVVSGATTHEITFSFPFLYLS